MGKFFCTAALMVLNIGPVNSLRPVLPVQAEPVDPFAANRKPAVGLAKGKPVLMMQSSAAEWMFEGSMAAFGFEEVEIPPTAFTRCVISPATGPVKMLYGWPLWAVAMPEICQLSSHFDQPHAFWSEGTSQVQSTTMR